MSDNGSWHDFLKSEIALIEPRLAEMVDEHRREVGEQPGPSSDVSSIARWERIEKTALKLVVLKILRDLR